LKIFGESTKVKSLSTEDAKKINGKFKIIMRWLPLFAAAC
jgi:hypothetical protein